MHDAVRSRNAGGPASGPRPVWRSAARGVRGRCPACGQGAILKGYISPISHCNHCGEDLSPYGTADFAPYLVTFAIGLIFLPAALLVSLRSGFGDWVIWVLLATAPVVAALLLPRAKGAATGLLWALDVRS